MKTPSVAAFFENLLPQGARRKIISMLEKVSSVPALGRRERADVIGFRWQRSMPIQSKSRRADFLSDLNEATLTALMDRKNTRNRERRREGIALTNGWRVW